MAVVSVSVDNLRIDSMDAVTFVTGIGGGAGAISEPDIVYQGVGAVSRKIGTSQRGFYTNGGGTSRDLTVIRRETIIYKVAIGNWTALDPQTTPGLRLSIGTDDGNYYYYDASLFTEYQAKGGFFIIAINPSIASHRDGTVGTVNLADCQYFAIEADFSATSKAENVVMDAVDACSGLYLVGGDGASADGNFQDFIDFDEGNISNRHGLVESRGGILFNFGQLWIGRNSGQTAVATEFTDNSSILVWNDGLFAAGYNGLSLDLTNASTVIDLSGCTFISRGTSAGEDTRAICDVVGSGGTLDVSGCGFRNFAGITLNNKVTSNGTQYISCDQIDAGNGADLRNSIINNSTGTSALLWDTNVNPGTVGETDGISFTSSGTGHGLELGQNSPTTINLNNVTFTGYAASDGSTGNEAIWVRRTSGTVTINVSSGSPSIRTDGATVNLVSNPVTTLVTVITDTSGTPLQGARVYIVAAAGGPLAQGTVIINALTDVNGQVSDSRTLASDQPIVGVIRKASSSPRYKTYDISDTISSVSGKTITALMTSDE